MYINLKYIMFRETCSIIATHDGTSISLLRLYTDTTVFFCSVRVRDLRWNFTGRRRSPEHVLGSTVRVDESSIGRTEDHLEECSGTTHRHQQNASRADDTQRITEQLHSIVHRKKRIDPCWLLGGDGRIDYRWLVGMSGTIEYCSLNVWYLSTSQTWWASVHGVQNLATDLAPRGTDLALPQGLALVAFYVFMVETPVASIHPRMKFHTYEFSNCWMKNQPANLRSLVNF